MNFLNQPGIYSITFPSGACYVGSARLIRMRWHEHKAGLRRGNHKNGRLQRSWNKWGEAAASFSVLIICSRENLLVYEQLALNALQPGLNICLMAGNSMGVKRSQEYRDAAAARAKGRKASDETKAKMSAARMGRSHSESTKEKIRSHRGWKHSEEAKAKMGKRIWTPEQRQKMSELKRGNKNRLGQSLSSETRAQISAKLKGRALPLSTRLKMSASRRGKRPVIKEQFTLL